jgi:hypothetical protein
VGDATGLRGSSAAGSLYFSLHTADPGEAGTQTTSEAAYTSYARVAVARSGSGFTVTANAVATAADVSFPPGTGGSGTATHFGIGTAASGAGVLLYKGAISPDHRFGRRHHPGSDCWHGSHRGLNLGQSGR